MYIRQCKRVKVNIFLRLLTSIGDHAGPCEGKGYGINIGPVEEHIVLRFLSRGEIVAVIVDKTETVEPSEGGGPDKAVPRCARIPVEHDYQNRLPLVNFIQMCRSSIVLSKI